VPAPKLLGGNLRCSTRPRQSPTERASFHLTSRFRLGYLFEPFGRLLLWSLTAQQQLAEQWFRLAGNLRPNHGLAPNKDSSTSSSGPVTDTVVSAHHRPMTPTPTTRAHPDKPPGSSRTLVLTRVSSVRKLPCSAGNLH